MRRDYTNSRSLYFPDRTVSLTLQILRCNNRVCSRYKLPHRPEVEWHYALPDTKFGLNTCAAIFAAHLDGQSNLAIHRMIAELGIPGSPRSIEGVLRRYRDHFIREQSSWSPHLLERLKKEKRAFIDILVGCDLPTGLHVLVRECFSNCVVADAWISRETADEELRGLFHAVSDRLPVPIVRILHSPVSIVRNVATQMWPRTRMNEVKADGLLGKRKEKRRDRRLSARPRRRRSS